MMRGLLAATGAASACLGTVGLFVPLLPTTPFLLLSAYCFSRSSPQLHEWLITHRHLGPYLERYRPGGRLSPGTLATTLAALWISITVSVVVVVRHPGGKAALVAVATAVSAYLVSRGRVGAEGFTLRYRGRERRRPMPPW